MAQAHLSPAYGATLAAASQISIRISPVIEREFKRRNVFPEFRLDRASSIINGATGVYAVSAARAREVLADAQAQRYNRDVPRGVPVAYGALVKIIDSALLEEARRGLLADPGMAEVQRQQAASSACFAVGDSVLYFRDYDEYGQEAVIVEAFRMCRVADEDGLYVTHSGQRLTYRNGYGIKLKISGECFFAAAYQLTRDDCKPAHLRLIAHNARSCHV